MTMKQLETPCWKLCAPGEKPSTEGQHWATRERAAEAASRGEVPQPFPSPCWIATCDGTDLPCGAELESCDEGWTVHAANPADLANAADYEGWETGPDGAVRCAECVDDMVKAAQG
jgi:hypothetical protein